MTTTPENVKYFSRHVLISFFFIYKCYKIGAINFKNNNDQLQGLFDESLPVLLYDYCSQVNV